MKIDKSNMRTELGNFLTQKLIFELTYSNPEVALYTVKDEDFEVVINGEKRKLLSLKKIFLEMEDVTEYLFATKYFYNWRHWQRVAKMKAQINPSLKFCDLVDEWREELGLKMRANALMEIAKTSRTEKGYQAAKFLADRGWEVRKAGKPTKAEKARHLKHEQRLNDEVEDDLRRMEMPH